MNAIILGVAGIVLFLSSSISLIFLLKRNFINCITSPIYMLVTSDILSSLLTVLLLFINQYRNIMSEGVDQDKQVDVMSLLKTINETKKEPVNCDFIAIVMNYSLFVIPFANSFISLLSMSIHYNFDVEILNKKCRNVLNTVENQKVSVFRNLIDKRNGLTVFTVISQWLLPIVLTAVLQFAEQENLKNTRRDTDINCLFTTNFPFENCYPLVAEFSNFSDNLLTDNYINNLALGKITENSTEADQVLSNIYSIVEAAVNESGFELTKPETHYDTAQLQNITNFSKVPEYEKEEVKLFQDLMKNVSNYYLTEYLTESLIPTTTEISTTISMKNSSKSDEEIHKEIMEKIQSINTKLIVKNKRKPGIPSARLHLSEEEEMMKLMENFSDGIYSKIPKCMENQCFISSDFLKIHLFLLLIFLYFAPILFSAVFNMRSKYICINATERLGASMRISKNESVLSSLQASKSSTCGWLEARRPVGAEKKEPEEEVKEEKTEESDGNLLESMKEEAEEMKKLADSLKSSLIMGIVLWTPVFLVILMKAFLCSNPPMWLMNLLYPLALSSGVVRNYLNLRILNSSEIVGEAFKKRNIIHPIPGTSTDNF